jgi:hypothetical protein
MNRTLSTQATAFSLALVVTLSLLASVNQLAASPAGHEVLATSPAVSAPLQVVVVTGKRMVQG